MGKFIFLSLLFHLILLVAFKLELIDLKNNKDKSINVGLAQENILTEKIQKKS